MSHNEGLGRVRDALANIRRGAQPKIKFLPSGLRLTTLFCKKIKKKDNVDKPKGEARGRLGGLER